MSSCAFDILTPYLGPKASSYLLVALIGVGALTVLCYVWRFLKFWVFRGLRSSSINKYKVDNAWAGTTSDNPPSSPISAFVPMEPPPQRVSVTVCH